MDRPLPRNGVYAARAGVALQNNLAAATAGLALKAHTPPERTLHLLTGWMIQRGLRLDGLTVDRPTLEDIYLELTAVQA